MIAPYSWTIKPPLFELLVVVMVTLVADPL
jgi:hypothetical protein